MILPKAQIADLLGVSGRRVDQLVHEGVAVRVEPGKFDAAQTVQNYIAKVSTKAEKQAAALDAEHELARQRRASADMTELRMAQMRGDLLPVDEVVFGWSHVLTNIRLAVLAVGPRLSQELGLSPEHTHAVDAELRRALTDLSDDPLKSFASLDTESGDEPAPAAETEAINVD